MTTYYPPSIIEDDPNQYTPAMVAAMSQMSGPVDALTYHWPANLFFRKVQLPLARIQSKLVNPDSKVENYIAQRRSGTTFPPILIEDYTPGGVLTPTDRNHRVLAAQICGDLFIHAFIPWT